MGEMRNILQVPVLWSVILHRLVLFGSFGEELQYNFSDKQLIFMV